MEMTGIGPTAWGFLFSAGLAKDPIPPRGEMSSPEKELSYFFQAWQLLLLSAWMPARRKEPAVGEPNKLRIFPQAGTWLHHGEPILNKLALTHPREGPPTGPLPSQGLAGPLPARDPEQPSQPLPQAQAQRPRKPFKASQTQT